MDAYLKLHPKKRTRSQVVILGGSSGDKKLLRVTWGEWVDFSGGQSNKGNTGGWVGGFGQMLPE